MIYDTGQPHGGLQSRASHPNSFAGRWWRRQLGRRWAAQPKGRSSDPGCRLVRSPGHHLSVPDSGREPGRPRRRLLQAGQQLVHLNLDQKRYIFPHKQFGA